ncbi:MAG: hypothetical protein WB778_00785 [Thermoplasmata archaeon]
MSQTNPSAANNSSRPKAAPTAGGPPPSRPTRYTRYTGTLLKPGPEAAGWIAALGIALAFAAFVEYLYLIAPVPLGGDTGTWTALSYPFIFYPHPSEIVPFGYPPGLFPLLGFFVLLGGGPLVGPRIYLGFAIVMLGLSTYVVGRSLFHFRISALLVEALLFATVPFDRLFFFGGYPTILALIFTNLALAFGVRFIRGRRPLHLFFFWLAVGATVLTHEFVGLALVVTLVIAGFFLLVKRQLPASLILSPAGAAGVTIAGAGAGAFYLGTRLEHIPQNNYLASNALGHLRFPISPVLYPLHLQSFGGLFGYQLIKTPTGSFEIAAGFAAIVFLGMLALAIWKPRYLTPSLVFVGASILAVIAMALAGWILSIYTDYRRFAYSLELPFLLIGMLAFDTVFYWCAPPSARKNAPSPVAAAPRRTATSPPTQYRPYRARRRTLWAPFLGLAGAIVVVLAGTVYAYPGLVHFQHQYNSPLHQWDYVHAMEAIQSSGIPGSILSFSSGAQLHWTFAMSDRNVYAPAIISGFLFKAARVSDSQLAYFPFHYRDSVSNGLEYLGVSSNASTNPNLKDFYDAAPAYGVTRYGTPGSVLDFAPDQYSVTFVNGTTVPAWNGTFPPVTTITNGTNPSLTTYFAGPGYDLNVTSTAIAKGEPVFVNITAQSLNGVALRYLDAAVRPPPGLVTHPKIAIVGSSFNWNVGIPGAFSSSSTIGTISSPGTITYGGGSSFVPGALSLKFLSQAANLNTGNNTLSMSIEINTPTANNVNSPLPQVIDVPAILANWDARFVLLENSTQQSGFVPYLVDEYGAVPFFSQGSWIVLLLPTEPGEPT